MRLFPILFFSIIGIFLISGCGNNSRNKKKADSYSYDTSQYKNISEIKSSPESANQVSSVLNYFDDLRSNKKYDLLKHYLYTYSHTIGGIPVINGVVNLYSGYIYTDIMQYDSAKLFYDKAIYSFRESKNPELLTRALIASADNARELGDYEKAIIERYHAINILSFKKADEYKRFVQIGSLGDDYLGIGKTSMAVELIDSALTYFYRIKDSANIASFESAKSFSLLLLNDCESSLSYARHSLKIMLELNDSVGIAGGYNNLAVAQMSMKQWSDALESLKHAEEMYKTLHFEKEIPKILINEGHCYLKLSDYENALLLLRNALDISTQRKQLNDVKIALQLISYVYSKSNDFKNAYIYCVKYSSFKDSVLNIEKEMAIRDIVTKSRLKQNEQQLLLISKEKEFAVRKNDLYILLLIVSLLLGFSFISFLFIQAHKNKQLFVAKQKLQELEIDTLQQDLTSKMLALENFTQSLVLKSKLVSELEETINEYKSKDDTRQIIEDISKLRDMRILTDEDWKIFKEHFEKCYPGLIYNVQTKISNISPAELRLLLLVKLNLDINDIASMLGISPSSVKKARYRLKSKLGLSNDDNLFVFINNEFDENFQKTKHS